MFVIARTLGADQAMVNIAFFVDCRIPAYGTINRQRVREPLRILKAVWTLLSLS